MKLTAMLRQARDDAGLTQAELARKVRVHRTAVSQWETGAKVPTLAHLIQVCRVLKIDKSNAIQIQL